MQSPSSPRREERAVSFGSIAEDYDRYRPGPVGEVLDWLLPPSAKVVVDLGAGTGALTRLLVERTPTVIAVEPDERMRAVLAERAPSADTREGTGDAMPLETASADAVVASSSWHWMDDSALPEVARVLRDNGVLGVVWSGPEWHEAGADNPLAALALLRRLETRPKEAEQRREHHVRRLVVPAGSPFSEPESAQFRWSRAMTGEELVGLIGTYSRVILLPSSEREALMERARDIVSRETALKEGGTIAVPFRALCGRSRRLAR